LRATKTTGNGKIGNTEEKTKGGKEEGRGKEKTEKGRI
jgi:hypothetical protein